MASASAAEDSGGGGGQGGGPTALTGPGAGNGQLSSAATSDQGAVSSDPFAVLSSEPSHGDETGLEGGQAAPGVPQQPVLATRTNTGSTLEKDLNNTYHGAYHPHFDHALSQEGVISSPTKSTYAQLTSSLRQRASFLASGPHLELKRTPTWQRMLLLKTVGLVGGLSLLSNNMLGPGLVTVPLLFQDAGWVLPVVAFIIYGSVAAFASLFIVEAMQSVPGNRRFKVGLGFCSWVSQKGMPKLTFAFHRESSSSLRSFPFVLATLPPTSPKSSSSFRFNRPTSRPSSSRYKPWTISSSKSSKRRAVSSFKTANSSACASPRSAPVIHHLATTLCCFHSVFL